jgi:hypothetical protein
MPRPFKAPAICGAVVILARRHCTFERPLAPTATSRDFEWPLYVDFVF